MPATAAVIVIGAGVMGASLAFHLTRAGLKPVTVLDKRGLCGGMTARSGALVRMHYTNEPEARMAFAALRYFQHWEDIVGGECGFTQTGFVMTVTPDNAERLRHNVAMLRRVGVNTSVLNPQELRELQPFTQVDDLAVAAYEPESGYADPRATATAFMQQALRHGATLREGVAVTAIRTTSGRVVGVDTTDGPFEAPIVVVMAGPWSDRLLRTVGIDLPLTPQRAQIAFYHRPPSLAEGHMVFIDGALGTYFRPHGEGLTLIGVGRWKSEPPPDPDHYDEGNDPDFIPAAKSKAARRIPHLQQAEYARGHAGIYDVSPDSRAILDRVPGIEGLYIAAGFSGTGFKISPTVGACMAELITQGRASLVDITPFRFSRFREHQPIRGAHEYVLPEDFGHRV
ncbi:MAG TPA: FAD-dependent oxidoreductase [Candidatus Tectomicrobia bacterium]|nr:FAD-dependent oxidoreductase [Candidatus Tectomicrobia bacterium]